MNETLLIKNDKKSTLPSALFLEIKDKILGKNYTLSIACVSRKISRELNNTYRGKDYATNILSFSLDDRSGEIILHLPTIKKDAPKFDKTFDEFLGFLVIHGMLHLKGMEHSDIMERQEEKYFKKFFKS